MTRSIRILPAALLIIGLVMSGCATSVPVKVVVMPKIDTSGIERLAIRPFTDRSGSGAGNSIAMRLTDAATQTITNTGKFTMVAATDPNADGIFTGEVRSLTSKDSNSEVQRRDSNGNPYTVIVYRREVNLEFSYSIISKRTDMPIGTVTQSGSSSDSNDNTSSGLKSVQDMALSIANNKIRDLEKDIIPYIKNEYRTLMKETSKDKAVKAKMKEAVALIKNENLELAIELYDSIARDFGSSAAKANAQILREAVASESSASAELDRLFSEKGGPVEKAINGALDMLSTKLGEGSNITIMKSQSTERSMLDRVVDRLTNTVVQSGKLNVIDRSNQALIEAEQQFQLSGNVSDDSAVSIGRQLGVKYIVLCWISGEMSERRLYLKVLDIETSEITTQDSFEI